MVNNNSEAAAIEAEPKIKLAGKDGKSDVDMDPFSRNNASKKLDSYLEEAKKERTINKDFEKDMSSVFADLQTKGFFDKDGEFNENRVLQKGNVRDLKNWSARNPTVIVETADNGKLRAFERANRYDDAGESYVLKKKLETAEDDRVLGIPYAQAMAGDRVFIVNGKIFTGWALYFSLSSIKSPEDYARNVDLVWNVPYLYSSILLKAQLGLGVGFDVNYGAEVNEVPEEKLIRKYLFKKLKINTQKLVKTGFHLYTYGNAYWALRRDVNEDVDKITILQPERLKIFLDPMTTRIMFYIYLPPVIGGTTIASYPSDGRYNPNILTGITLSYPTPIVMHPEDVIHFKVNDFTEYPFGFSDVKTCIDPATARLDVNILAPIIFKKYTKPMIHWILNTEGLGPKQVGTKRDEMISMLEDMEPGSDPVTTDRWGATELGTNNQKADIFNLSNDMDTQIFASTGAPETYFKPKGSTDRMISEQDKTFISRLKVPQSIVAEQIEDKLIKPLIYKEIRKKWEIKKAMNEVDVVDEILQTYDSWLATEPKYPEVVWKEIFKQDETQSIANAIALLNAGVIDKNRAAVKCGETPPAQQAEEDKNRVGLDDPIHNDPFANNEDQVFDDPNKESGTPKDFQKDENMEALRGGMNVAGQKDQSSRNINDVKDPSQLGGSRYEQHKTKGDKGDISQKHVGLEKK